MSVKTRVPLSLITSSVTAPPVEFVSLGAFGRVVAAIQNFLGRILSGPTIRRSLHNQDALLENMSLLRRNPEAELRASLLRAAYAEIEPTEAKHLELVYLAEGADLFSEGRPWVVHYGPEAVVIVNRSTRLAIGSASRRLRARLKLPGGQTPG